MNPKRPYLLRALLDWIIDNQQTPYVLVQAGADVVVPNDFVQDGRIVLNLSPMAIRGLSLTNDEMTFDGRFAGRSFQVQVPMHAVLAIYAKETGEGMLFEPEYSAVPGRSAPGASEGTGPVEERSASGLTAVKPDQRPVVGVSGNTDGSAPARSVNAASHLKVVK